MSNKINQNDLVNYLKNYGFIYQSSEIYNGLANAWDFGPIGVLLKNNIKNLWWKEFITKVDNMYGLDSAIILNSDVWKASGHLSNFSDPLIDCKKCKNRFRADKLVDDGSISENSNNEIVQKILKDNKISCPSCKSQEWTDIRKFNLLFKTEQGVIEDKKNTLYLRPETAQGIFINFKNIQRTTRAKLDFGVGQIGKAFRNEITPSNFIFRTREFEQMEIEFFHRPENSKVIFNDYQNKINSFLIEKCNLDKNNLRIYNHPKEKLSHYSSKTIDFEYLFAHGWGELWGLADRSNFDLIAHQNASKKELYYFDTSVNSRIIPCTIEPSVGVERLLYAILYDNYKIEKIGDENQREVLTLPIELSPYKVAILPLNNKLEIESKEIYQKILDLGVSTIYDSSGNIGKRYRRQDAIGTKYCVTIDFNTKETNSITIRERDSMKQETIDIKDLKVFLTERGIH